MLMLKQRLQSAAQEQQQRPSAAAPPRRRATASRSQSAKQRGKYKPNRSIPLNPPVTPTSSGVSPQPAGYTDQLRCIPVLKTF